MKIPVKLIYVCGPLNAPTQEGINANTERAFEAGRMVWRLGAMAIVPHLNSPSHKFGDVMPAASVYLADLELMERCDAIFRLTGWENSFGSKLETAWANFRQIPIFDKEEELENYLSGYTARNTVDVYPRHDYP